MIYQNLSCKATKHGFSLIELAISLVIIALLILTISSADKLNAGAKLSKVISEFQALEADIYSFKTTYNSLPGDFHNAYNYWQNNCDNNPDNCNGDGNNLINYNTTLNQNIESYRAWQHLYLAEIKNDFYTTGTAISGEAVIGQNIPESKLTNTGYTLLNADFTVHNFANYITLGAAKSGEYARGGGLTALQAYKIDKKIDDTNPLKGNFLTLFDLTNTCYNNATSYNLNDIESKNCWVAFKLN
ncbi:MAG: type II secretion system protein [Rickettsiales bacterium]